MMRRVCGAIALAGLVQIHYAAGETPPEKSNSHLQVIAETFMVQKRSDHAAGTRETISGFGDVSVRWKLNFWGNDLSD
jgi:hypothetical protein